MKKFSEYLMENVRDYTYSVKLAFKPDNEVMDKIEAALAKYSLVNISAPRSLPIQRIDKDFPGIKAPEVYVFTVTTAYPSTPYMIQRTIEAIGLELEKVSVCSTSHDKSMDEEDDAVAANTGDTALLDSDYQKDDNDKISSENYGDKYNEKLVKNSIGSTDQMIPKGFKKEKGKTLNDPEFKSGDRSAIGSTKNYIPKISSFAR